MTKKEFENLYGEELNLSNKNWFLMSVKSMLSNNRVMISGYREIDFDYLYFIYKDEVWEMDLNSNVRFVECDFMLPKALFKKCITEKRNHSYGVDMIEFRNSGVKGQVAVILDHFATKKVSILEEKSEATKWGENMISAKEITEFEKSKELKANWVVPEVSNTSNWPEYKTFETDLNLKVSSVPVKSNATTIVPEEMFDKPCVITAECFNMLSSYPVTEEKPTKISEGKLFYELDWEFVEGMAKRMELNKQNGKYSVFGWRDKGVDVPEMNQALIRHLIAILKGEIDDSCQEYGHYLALACNSMLIINQLKKDKNGTTTV